MCVYNEQYVLLKTDNNAYELFPNYVPPYPFASKSGGINPPPAPMRAPPLATSYYSMWHYNCLCTLKGYRDSLEPLNVWWRRLYDCVHEYCDGKERRTYVRDKHKRPNRNVGKNIEN